MKTKQNKPKTKTYMKTIKRNTLLAKKRKGMSTRRVKIRRK